MLLSLQAFSNVYNDPSGCGSAKPAVSYAPEMDHSIKFDDVRQWADVRAKKKKRRGNVFQCWLLGPFQCASVEEGCVCEKGTEELVREREREG